MGHPLYVYATKTQKIVLPSHYIWKIISKTHLLTFCKTVFKPCFKYALPVWGKCATHLLRPIVGLQNNWRYYNVLESSSVVFQFKNSKIQRIISFGAGSTQECNLAILGQKNVIPSLTKLMSVFQVLSSGGLINVKQEEAYGDVILRETPKLEASLNMSNMLVLQE